MVIENILFKDIKNFILKSLCSEIENSTNSTLYKFLGSRSRGNALQFFYFSAKCIATGSIHEPKDKKRANGSIGDATTKLYKVEIRCLGLTIRQFS